MSSNGVMIKTIQWESIDLVQILLLEEYLADGHRTLKILYFYNSQSLRLKMHVLAVVKVNINPYPTAFPYGNGMVLHFYQQQESSTTKTVHKVINKGLKTYV